MATFSSNAVLMAPHYPYPSITAGLTSPFRRLRFFEPVLPFRSRMLYNNNMYTLAGVAAERLRQESWEDLTRRYIFEPLDMTSSDFMHQSNWDGNFAVPYTRINGAREEVPRDFFRLVCSQVSQIRKTIHIHQK